MFSSVLCDSKGQTERKQDGVQTWILSFGEETTHNVFFLCSISTPFMPLVQRKSIDWHQNRLYRRGLRLVQLS